ncbi:N-acetylmuramoyl-L-alanine amidase [Paenibacillus pasadenensis]|uniref:N-acetylmuramoyl-L-alanine amidase n=1 Tax=Paenibacillus pasadenensis TaxID=217090 RepID=UPI00203B0426|nr:N-acetylmuramoyl-L-alanine amidase [Paenibacillus pasadenensis]MCM3747321.1 N-acetylmuramoyl-L-alanine amidase [Paenibacillus pasadenensis]
MSYDIHVDLIPDLPSEAYRNGIAAWEGVCIHDTECPGDSMDSEVSYFKRNWRSRKAFVHAFVDGTSMTQCAKWEFKSWGCGNGNNRFINIEMCSAQSAAEFNEIYKRTCWLAALKLNERKLGVMDGVTLVSHDWVRRNLGGTTHTDPIAYLKQWGKSWADMVKDVETAYEALTQPELTSDTHISDRGIQVAVDDHVIAKGILIDGRSYAPIRAIGEALGAEVAWDSKSGLTSVDGTVMKSTVNQDGVTYAWSAELAQVTKKKLEWDGKTKTIYFWNE